MKDTVAQTQITMPDGTKIDWWKPAYLLSHIIHESYSISRTIRKTGVNPLEADADYTAKRYGVLVNLIIQTKRYHVLVDWYYFYLAHLPGMLASYENENNISFDKRMKLVEAFQEILLFIYSEITIRKKALLVGTASPKNPLWLTNSGIDNLVFNLQKAKSSSELAAMYSLFLYLIRNMPFFTGDQPQGSYDKLVFPESLSAEKLFPIFWTAEMIENFEEGLTSCEPLNMGGEPVAEDELVQILSDAFLNQSYALIEGRPVLVRLQNHPIVHEVVLTRKVDNVYNGLDMIFARIETHRFGTLLHNFALNELTYDGTLDYAKTFNGLEMKENLALTALIASIYRDLIIVEKHEAKDKRFTGRGKREQLDLVPVEASEKAQDKPKLFTTIWQYIPRRVSLTRPSSTPPANTHKALTEKDRNQRERIRRWHMVCRHVRRYPDKPGWMASGDKQDEALAAGLMPLKPGETYVKPHARNVDALAELGEISIEKIPHYLRRKFKEV
jgi:hypothetical protein